MPLGCSENQPSLQEFIIKAKVALVAVGIIRDAAICKFVSELVFSCHRKSNECIGKVMNACFTKFYLSSTAMSTWFSMGSWAHIPKLLMFHSSQISVCLLSNLSREYNF